MAVDSYGLAEMTLRGDWTDLSDFDVSLSAVAAALAATGDEARGAHESLDVRRALAVGVLADPHAALALLAGDDGAASGSCRAPAHGTQRGTTPARRQVQLFLHLSEDAVLGRNPVVRVGGLRGAGSDRPMLAEAVRAWLGRPDLAVQVHPVIDLHDHVAVDAYEVPDRLRTRTDLLRPQCVFPWCTRPARRCDKDHVVPYQSFGRTCDCNLAPLCRRHHRLKTHAGWHETAIEPGVYLWTAPHGQRLLRDHTGTADVTPPGARRPSTRPDGGCVYSPALGPPGADPPGAEAG